MNLVLLEVQLWRSMLTGNDNFFYFVKKANVAVRKKHIADELSVSELEIHDTNGKNAALNGNFFSSRFCNKIWVNPDCMNNGETMSQRLYYYEVKFMLNLDYFL